MKNKIKLIIFISAVFILMSACKNNISYEKNSSDFYAWFTIGTLNDRAVMPDYKNDSFDEYILKGTLDEEEKDFGSFTSYKTLSSKKFKITTGDWTFKLTAKKGQTIYTSTINKTIVKGENTLNFSLKAKQLDLENGKGNIEFELTVPSEITKVTYSLLDFENLAPVTDFTAINSNVVNQKSILSLKEVPAGTYYIDALLLTSDNVKVNTYRTVVSVCDGITSKGSFTISQTNTIYTISFAQGHYSFVDGTIIPASFTTFDTSTITLPDADDISAPFNFLGWYLTNDYSGEALTTLTPTTPGNITLYPRWGNEITCTAEELKEYITDFSNTEIIVHITDLNPSFYTLRDALKKNQTVTVKLDLDACKDLTYFSSTLNECNNLISVSIPENVTEIGNYALYKSYNLQEINYNAKNITAINYAKDWITENTGKDAGGVVLNIGAGVETIPENFLYVYDNSCIKEINFPENSSLKKIGQYAFYEVDVIEEVIISDNITNIGSYAFGYCSNLKTVRILNKDVVLDSSPFYQTDIHDIYFNGTFTQWSDFCGNSSKVNCNTKNGSNLYLNNELLTEITLNDKEVNHNQFSTSNLNSITTITIGENVEKITGAFTRIYDLKTIYFNAINCHDISSSDYLFGNVVGSSEGITAIIGNKVTRIPGSLFKKSSYSSYILNLTNVIFADNSVCTEIGKDAFYNNINLKNIYLPASITTIGGDAYYSKGIENVYFDGTIEQWYSNITFDNWDSNPLYYNESNLYVNKNELVEVLEFPEGTTDGSMNPYAFTACKSLKKVIIPSSMTTLPKIYYAYYVEELVYGPSAYNFDFENSSGYSGCFSSMGFKAENGIKLTIGKDVIKIPDYFRYSGIDPVEINFEDNCICSEIGEEAFAELRKLKRVTIPESITKIGEKAFAGGYYDYDKSIMEEIIYNAKNAQSAAWSWTDSCFIDSGEKTEGGIKLIIGAQVECINKNIFNNTNISSVVFEGTNISKFENDAFVKCSINKVEYPGTQRQWESIVFGNQNSSPCCTGGSLYISGTKITSVSIPEGTERIPDGVYSGCKDITTVTLPSTLKAIGAYCFYNCTGLSKITIPESVEEIYTSPFYGCKGLTEINYNAIQLTKNSSYVGYMFYNAGIDTEGCTVNFGKNVIEVPYGIFGQARTNIIKVNFEANSNLQIIKDWAFANISGLTEITIPDTVEKILRGAFENTSIKTIIIPDSVTYIDGDEVFRDCKLLKSATIGSGLTKIPRLTFYCCDNLTEVTFKDTDNWYKKDIDNISLLKENDRIDVTDSQANAELLKEGNYYLLQKQ